jgi:Transposase DDE domain group 1
MGDSQNDAARVDFDRQIKLEFHGSTVTSDAGLLAYRELDDALRLTTTAATGLHDTRTGQNTQHSLLALLRQSIYSRLAGYEDVNDAVRLCLDPALRIVVGGRAKGGAPRALGSSRDGAGCGSVFGGKSLQSYLRGANVSR